MPPWRPAPFYGESLWERPPQGDSADFSGESGKKDFFSLLFLWANFAPTQNLPIFTPLEIRAIQLSRLY